MKKEQRKYLDLADKFKSIGHPQRLAILDLLCTCGRERMTVKEIYSALKRDQPSTSRHLGIMRVHGVLERNSEGGESYYSLANDLQVDCEKRFCS